MRTGSTMLRTTKARAAWWTVASLFAIALGGCSGARGRASAEADSTLPSSSSVGGDRAKPKPIQVAAGDRATCALLDDGGVWCWGKLDLYVDHPPHPPTLMTAVPAARSIAVGADGCAITRDDGIVCGWLGSGLYTVTGVDNPDEIAVADDGSGCATSREGTVACWEDPPGYQKENRTSAAKRVEAVGPGVALRLGHAMGCVVHRDERKLQCWSPTGPVPVESPPAGPFALAGEDGCAVDGRSILCTDARKIDAVAFGEIAEIGMSENGVCGRSTGGAVFCATRGGRFDPADDVVAGAHALATRIELPKSAQLTVGATHACSLSVAGEIDCWGNDAGGEASGRSAIELPPTELPIGDFTEIALGHGNTCVLSNNTVACTDGGATCPTGKFETVRAQHWHESSDEHWEHAHLLASGHGVCIASRREKAVWDRATDTAGRKRKAGAARRTKETRSQRRVEHEEFLVCLENDRSKEIGYRLPSGTLDRATQLMLGHGFLCLLTRAGGVECVELGEREYSSPRARAISEENDAALRFVPLASLPAAKALVEVDGHRAACALTTDGETFCWRGAEAPRRTSASKAKSIAGGRDRICQLDVDRNIGCSKIEHPRERIPGIERAQAMAVGDDHGCAIDELGRVRCWDMDGYFSGDDRPGDDERGTSAPVELPGAATELFAGGGTSCARLKSGRVFCWGNNARGRLGVGVSTCRARPVRVSVPE